MTFGSSESSTSRCSCACITDRSPRCRRKTDSSRSALYSAAIACQKLLTDGRVSRRRSTALGEIGATSW